MLNGFLIGKTNFRFVKFRVSELSLNLSLGAAKVQAEVREVDIIIVPVRADEPLGKPGPPVNSDRFKAQIKKDPGFAGE